MNEWMRLMEFNDLSAQQRVIRKELDERIANVLSHGKYILGPEVDELEAELAAYTDAGYCVTVANGTDALQIALMALNVGAGDEVITPAFSYIAAAEAASFLGAKVVYVDIDPETFNIDPNLIESSISSRTKVILPVSLFGQPADFDAINWIAERYGVEVIEDAAQSFGAARGTLKSCNLSRLACTSFFPSKPLGCYGDGGAIFTSDDSLASALRQIARHGQAKRYYHTRVGVNSRLDSLQAGILLSKLKILDDEISARGRLADYYSSKLRVAGVATPSVEGGVTSAWAQYTIRLSGRDKVTDRLAAAGIPTAVHYPQPIYKQPAFSEDAWSLPHTELAAKEVLSLPLHPYLSLEQLEWICEELVAAL